MATVVVDLAAADWTLVASGPAVLEVQMNRIGEIKLREAASLPSGEPAKDTYWALNGGESKRFSLGVGENLYAWSDSEMNVSTDLETIEIHMGQVGGHIFVAGASFARPADTSAYIVGDIMLDSTVAATANANVVAGTAGIMRLHVARTTDKTGMVRRLRLKTNDTAFAAATVRVHLFKDRPTVTNGDNGAFLTTESNYIGYSDVVLDRHFSDAEKGIGVPVVGSEWNFEPSAGTDYIHAILETRTAVTPGNAKVWTLAAETHQN